MNIKMSDLNELGQNKTNKMTNVPNEDSDQAASVHCLPEGGLGP